MLPWSCSRDWQAEAGSPDGVVYRVLLNGELNSREYAFHALLLDPATQAVLSTRSSSDSPPLQSAFSCP